MKILMSETRRGTDGFTVCQYQEGETYTVRESLGREFVAKGYATKLEEEGPIAAFMSQHMLGLNARFDAIGRSQDRDRLISDHQD